MNEMEIFVPLRFRLEWTIDRIGLKLLRKVSIVDGGVEAGDFVFGSPAPGAEIEIVTCLALAIREGGVLAEEAGIAIFYGRESEWSYHGYGGHHGC